MTIVGVMLWRLPKNAGALMSTSLALVFGGAFGNLWDRIFRGSVTDFLQVFLGSYEFPAFNVADSAITIGAALLIIDLLRTRKATPA
jgi:signal peptidase II